MWEIRNKEYVNIGDQGDLASCIRFRQSLFLHNRASSDPFTLLPILYIQAGPVYVLALCPLPLLLSLPLSSHLSIHFLYPSFIGTL